MNWETTPAKTSIAVECAICDDVFYSVDFGENHSADGCRCSNVIISIAPFVPPSHTGYYIMLKCADRANVKIYEVDRETRKQLEPYKEY